MKLKQQLESLQDAMSLLACSSGLVNKDNTSVSKDPEMCELIAQALEVYRQLLRGLGCGQGQGEERHVCLGDFLAHRIVIEQREAVERERQRQEMLRVHEELRRKEALLQQQQSLQDGSTGSGDLGEEVTALQQRLPAVLAAMQGLNVGSGSSGGGSGSSNPRQSRPRRSGSGQQQQQQEQQGVQPPRQQGRHAGGGSSSGGGRSGREQGRRQGSAPAHLQAAQASAQDRQPRQRALQSAAHSASFSSGLDVAQQRALQPAAHSAPHSTSFSSGLEVLQARARHEASSSSSRVAPGVQAVERVVGSRLAANALAGLGGPSKAPSRTSNGYVFKRHVQTEQQ
jgi:hypothetical protein